MAERRNFICGRIADGRKQAEAKRREVLHQADGGKLRATDKLTFRQLVDRFKGDSVSTVGGGDTDGP